jgi:hypothetical protein
VSAYKTVDELTSDEILELKERLFYGDDEHKPLIDEYLSSDSIPLYVVKQNFDGIQFVEDDFFVNGWSEETEE